MTDPLGLIGPGVGGLGAARYGAPAAPSAGQSTGGASPFKEMLQQQIERVNELQSNAHGAMEDLAAGRRSDVEGVIFASTEADVAFKLLLQVRNKVMEAYDEVKQMRI